MEACKEAGWKVRGSKIECKSQIKWFDQECGTEKENLQSLREKCISLGICVSQVGEHISLGKHVSQVGEHISVGICVSQVEEHISPGICLSQVGEHISQ